MLNTQPKTFVNIKFAEFSQYDSTVYQMEGFTKVQKEGKGTHPAIARPLNHFCEIRASADSVASMRDFFEGLNYMQCNNCSGQRVNGLLTNQYFS